MADMHIHPFLLLRYMNKPYSDHRKFHNMQNINLWEDIEQIIP